MTCAKSSAIESSKNSSYEIGTKSRL
jgi:hypothetical protein